MQIRQRIDRIAQRAYLIFGVAVLTLFLSMAWQPRALAVGSMYLTPSSPSVQKGNNITLSLRINPATPVTTVATIVNFDTSKLQLVGANASSSPFGTQIAYAASGGSISMDRAILSPAGVNSNSLIASYTFKALASSGNTVLSVSGNAAYEGAYTNPGTSGATVRFTAPASSGSTSQPGSTGANKDADKKEESKLTKPSITGEEWQYTVAKVSVSTNVAAKVQIKYGLAKDKLSFQTDLTGAKASHDISITEKLPPATVIYYQVIAQDKDKTTKSDIREARTKGMSMRVALLDKNLDPIVNQEVSLTPSGKTATSNDRGFVEFDELPLGEYTIELSQNGTTHKQLVYVSEIITTDAGVQSAPLQTKAVVFDSYGIEKEDTEESSQPVVWWTWIAVAALLAGLGVGAYILWRRIRMIQLRKRRQ